MRDVEWEFADLIAAKNTMRRLAEKFPNYCFDIISYDEE